jgi:hypothetical protein
MIGSVFQCVAANLPMIFAGRAVAGFAVGMLTMVVPLYISEVSQIATYGSAFYKPSIVGFYTGNSWWSCGRTAVRVFLLHNCPVHQLTDLSICHPRYPDQLLDRLRQQLRRRLTLRPRRPLRRRHELQPVRRCPTGRLHRAIKHILAPTPRPPNCARSNPWCRHALLSGLPPLAVDEGAR